MITIDELEIQQELISKGMTRYLIYDIKLHQCITNRTRHIKKIRTLEVNIVLTNMLACIKKGYSLHYSRNNSWTKKSKYNKIGINNKNIIKAIDQLEDLGYLLNYKTQPQTIEKYRISSWIKPTQLFLDTFCTIPGDLDKMDIAYIKSNEYIILRDKDGKSIDYTDTAMIKEARRVLVGINILNSQYECVTKDGEIINNTYSRIFNNGSFDYGGRFYRASILSIKNKISKDRLRVTIGGEKCIEVDYSALHIRLMAIISGIVLDESHVNDIYYTPLPLTSRSEENRNLIKTAVNIMINSTCKNAAYSSINKKIKELPKVKYFYKTGKQVSDSIYRAFPQFANYFCCSDSTGLALQGIDAWIAHDIMDVFLERQIPILMIHDSMIVRERDTDLLITTMRDAFNKRMNVSGKVKMKFNNIDSDGDFFTADCSC